MDGAITDELAVAEHPAAADAPTVLFLHSLATSGWMWHRQVDDLADMRAIVPDLPGHGGSNAVEWRSLALTAELVARETVRRVQHERVTVVGLSLGGYVALQLLADHPEIVGRMVISGVSVLERTRRAQALAAITAAAPFVHSDVVITAHARNLQLPKEKVRGYRRSVKQMTVRSFVAAARSATEFTLPDRLAENDRPTLVLAGSRERASIRDSLTHVGESIGCARVRLVPGVGHAWNAERPALFSQTVRAWVAGDGLPTALRRPDQSRRSDMHP